MSTMDGIRQRAEAATEGPWAVEETEDGSCDGSAVYADEGFVWGRVYICQDMHQGEEGEADAEFIAHARTDIPRLLAALDAIRDAQLQAKLTVHGRLGLADDIRKILDALDAA